MIKVSIVVPVYNVEKYIERCIRSLINQTYANIEIIIVDDGSPDGSATICEEWSKKDSRIRIFHKENAGLGMARNFGIDLATGEYITFVDGDDYLIEDSIERAVAPLHTRIVDSIVFGFNRIDSYGNVISTYVPHPEKYEYFNDAVQKDFLPDLISPDISKGKESGLWMSASGCLIRMKLIKDIDFHFVSERDIISEDVYSLIQLYKYVKSVVVLQDALYCYCINESSLTHTYRRDRFEKITECYVKTVELADSLGLSSAVIPRIGYKYISNTIAAFKMIVTSDLSKKEQLEQIQSALSKPEFHNMLTQLDYTHESRNRKLLIICMKNKWKHLVYQLTKLKAN